MNNLPANPNRRVLVIDDNRSIHDDFRKILSAATAAEEAAFETTETAVFGRPTNAVPQTQFTVDSACQGQEGVLLVQKALAAGLPYALAFVDVRMPPGWDGVETARKIWELDPNLQVVLCTAYSDYSWDEMFEKLGHRDGLLILKKPFDTVEALQLAHALTEKWWLHQQSRQRMEELESRVAGRTRELQQANQTLLTEVAERKRAEEQARSAHAQLEQMLAHSLAVIYRLKVAGESIIPITASDNITQLLGFSVAETLSDDWWLGQLHPEDHDRVMASLPGLMRQGTSRLEYRLRHKAGGYRWVDDNRRLLRDAAGQPMEIVGVWMDSTERKRLEAQLFQSQKMETVGKLAGGIAHEFNNILTAIIGQSEIMLRELPARSPLAESVTEINKAAGRAAMLTRQLLAYGRKQMLQPETLDLNQVVANMTGMFYHLMGDTVDTQIVPAPGLKAVQADVGQIEQVIMNLIFNAREAMPNGGKLTLETANVSFDPDSVGRNPELKPGDYVMLAITDTGTGMSEEVKARAFEPFFTTKTVGQGTGLGLSTCYGIIKQSGGHISVYSEPGRGTTFKIYLPQIEPPTTIPFHRPDASDLPRGTETILLVEDDPAVREMAVTVLKRQGYTVLAAANGIEALGLKQQRDIGHIDLLFTDVVMPHMSGKELSDRVRALYPHTRILFTSAYAENAIVHQGVLEKGTILLQKPFTPGALAHKVREVLDQPKVPKPGAAQKTVAATEPPDGENIP